MTINRFALSLWLVLSYLFGTQAQPTEKNLPPKNPQFNFRPSERPDRILLTYTDDPATTFTVTWRTDTTVSDTYAEIALADPSPEFDDYEQEVKSSTQILSNSFASAAYHRVTFTNLKPNTLYVYRVVAGPYYREWIQTRTASQEAEAFQFIYLGDAQNDLYSHWARGIRAAYAAAPDAAFILHAGDLINHSQNDYEWGEWFEAGSFIHRMVPTLAAIGNHEYIKNEAGKKVGVSPFWAPQFNFPTNGPEGQEDMAYYLDYQDCRIVVLNSNEAYEAQAVWLEQVLDSNPKRWTVVSFHHPVVSAAKGRVNDAVLNQWKPILDKNKVDLVLQGHDHTYARGQNLETGLGDFEKTAGTVYVVSICGSKMYELTEQDWMLRKAENTQLYQVIRIEADRLIYQSKTVDGRVYDAFEVLKMPNGPNQLIELPVEVKEERRFKNTLKDR